jgi:hypothetical protein
VNQDEHYTAGMAALRKAENLATQRIAGDLTEPASRVCALAAVATAHFAAASARAQMTPAERDEVDS